MYIVGLFIFAALVCGMISLYFSKQKKKEKKKQRPKLKIDNYRINKNGKYEFVGIADNTTICFEHDLLFPHNAILEYEITDKGIQIYSEGVDSNELFNVLSKIEKWRYAGVLFAVAAIISALIESGRMQFAILGLSTGVILGVLLFLLIRSNERYKEYCQEEDLSHIINVDYQTIKVIKNKAYVWYYNHKQDKVIAVIPKQDLENHPRFLLYHEPSEAILRISKNRLNNIRMVSLICCAIYMFVAIIITLINLF